MAFKLASGHDNTAGHTTLTMPIHSTGLLYPRHMVAISGIVYATGAPYSVWTIQHLTVAQYQAILTAAGISAVYSDSNEVTVSDIIPDRSTYADYNATIVHMSDKDMQWAGHHDRWIQQATFTFIKLEAL